MDDYNFFANTLIEQKPVLFNNLKDNTIQLYQKSESILDNDYCRVSTIIDTNSLSTKHIVFYEDKTNDTVYLYLINKELNKTLSQQLNIFDTNKPIHIFTPFTLSFPINELLNKIEKDLKMSNYMLILLDKAFLNYFPKNLEDKSDFINNSAYPKEVLLKFLNNEKQALEFQRYFKKLKSINSYNLFTLSHCPSKFLDYLDYLKLNGYCSLDIEKDDIFSICSGENKLYENELPSWIDTIKDINNICSIHNYTKDNPLSYYEDCSMWKDFNLITLIDSNSFTIIEQNNNEIIFYFSHFDNFDESEKYNTLINKIKNKTVDPVRDIALNTCSNKIVYCFQEPSYLVRTHLETIKGFMFENKL